MSPLRDPLRYWIVVAWMLVLAVCGGASRSDELAQQAVRAFAVVVIAAALWTPALHRLRRDRAIILFAAACVAVIVVQLIPLPPGLWAALPGRALYRDVAATVGLAPTWRPISLAPDMTLDALYALLPALATLISVVSMPAADRPRLALPLLAIVLASAVLGQFQLLGVAITPYRVVNEQAAIGLFANRNHAAAFLAIGIVLVGLTVPRALRSKTWQRVEPVVAAMLVAMLLVTILVTGSRGGILVGFIGLIGGGLLYVTGRRAHGDLSSIPSFSGWRRLALLALPVVAVALVTAAAVFQPRAIAVHRLVTSDPLDDVRAQRVGPLIETARTFFPVGSGHGTFRSVFERFEPRDQLRLSYANHAHNEPLQLLIEGGLLSVALAILFVVWAARRSVAAWRRAVPGDARIAAARAGAVIVLIAIVTSLNDYPVRTPLFAATLVIACIWLSNRRAALQDDERAPVASTAKPA